MADTPAKPATPPVNDIPPVYPKHTTTSDLPDATAAPAAPAPVLGAEPDETALAEPAPSPPSAHDAGAPVVRRGRPSAADRRISALEAQIGRLASALETRVAPAAAEPPKPAADPEPPRPKRADFNDPDEYDDALIEWTDDRAERRAVRLAAENETQRKAREKQEADAKAAKVAEDEAAASAREWSQKWEAAKDKYGDDFEDIAASADIPMSPSMYAAITNSDIGPDIAWFLGNNTAEATRIFALTNPIKQALEIGKIEAKLIAQPAEPKPEPVAAPTAPSAAALAPRAATPRPIRPVTPRSAPAPEEPTEQNSESRIAARLAELRKGNQPLGWGPTQGRA